MFNLTATELKLSKISLFLWSVIFLSYITLLQLYWMPFFIRVSLYFGVGIVGFFCLLYPLRRIKRQIGIDEEGAFLYEQGHYIRLSFVRVNSIQLIAKKDQSSRFLEYFWPRFYVIFRDSLTAEQYQILRSFSAQQMLLRKSKETKKPSKHGLDNENNH